MLKLYLVEFSYFSSFSIVSHSAHVLAYSKAEAKQLTEEVKNTYGYGYVRAKRLNLHSRVISITNHVLP